MFMELHYHTDRDFRRLDLAEKMAERRGRSLTATRTSSLMTRLARLARARDGTRGDGSRGGEGEVVVRWGLAEDEEKIATLLQLNGMPSRIAAGKPFVVAEEDGEVVAALRYTLEPKRLALGLLVADPWRGERRLAVSLYAGAKRLAWELGVVEVRAWTTKRGHAYPREAGYRRGLDGRRWQVGVGKHQTNQGGGVPVAPAA
jgi:N-acetylglutamate synthase-like GNAT family acetyltransferase